MIVIMATHWMETTVLVREILELNVCYILGLAKYNISLIAVLTQWILYHSKANIVVLQHTKLIYTSM